MIPEVFRQRETQFITANEANVFEQEILAVTINPQGGNNLCWAAIIEALELAYGIAGARTQCRIASAAFGTNCCVGSAVANSCDRARVMLTALGPLLRSASTAAETRTPEFVRTRIRNGFPLVAQIDWNNGGQGHVVIITGYRRVGGTYDLYICNPATGTRSYYRFDQFTNNFEDKGKWVATFETQSSESPLARVLPA